MFENIIGQEKAKEVLTSQIKSGKIAHAYIFIGQEGVGKRFFATEVAKTLNCTINDYTKTAAGACQKCDSCQHISKKTHLDVHFLDFETQFQYYYKEKKEAFKRELRIDFLQSKFVDDAFIKCREGKIKVFIIEPAEKINPAAANSILKTLEEPPANTVVFLIATRKEGIPITILSRCQTIFFAPLSESQVQTFLMENRPINKEDAARIALRSEGSIERANKLFDGNGKADIFWKKIQDKELQDLPIVDLLELSKAFLKIDTPQKTKDKDDAPKNIRDEAIKNIDDMTDLAKEHFRLYPQETAPILELFSLSRTLLSQNANPQTVLDNLLLDLGSLEEF
ncbi:MAG: hypothetical protein LBB93_05630 [Elusimicrobiota bacterium]|jgi:DNA polymerase-3 subunit delta'|nr:hypothetical protein [Elusimicrobiota bacterium]